MSPRHWRERVEDILVAIREVGEFTTGMDAMAFAADPKTVKAVVLNFIVIGEAAAGVPEGIQTAHAEIPWSVMRAMRNRLVHAYFSIDPQIVWDTVHQDLMPLEGPLRALLTP